MSKLRKIAPATYLLDKEGAMLVEGLVIANDELLKDAEMEKPLTQVKNVAELAGIVGYSIAMPDIHWGYGFPIGGIAAMDPDQGVISPGGVGYDINCGVRMATAPLQFNDLSEKDKEKLLSAIYHYVPSGVGHGGKKHLLSEQDYEKILRVGAKWAIETGLGLPQDLDHIESNGQIPGANPSFVSTNAKERGKNQLGSIGSGNHFVEMGQIQKIFQNEVAKSWGVQEGQLYILIHSGSRGFGHQVCQDTLNHFIHKGYDENLPDRQLVAARIKSEDGKRYFAAMAAAANFAFCNRQTILHGVRKAFQQILGIDADQIHLLYDVCHNIAKFETHLVNNRKKELLVHRKGATRAFGPAHPELAPLFQPTGQPVLVPGDMGGPIQRHR